MNPGIVILEYTHAITEEIIHWLKTLVIQYFQVVSFWAHIVAEPRPDQLNQLQIKTLPPQVCGGV